MIMPPPPLLVSYRILITGCDDLPMAESAPVPPALALRTVLGMRPHPPNPPIRAEAALPKPRTHGDDIKW